jgi:hypothetical protein
MGLMNASPTSTSFGPQAVGTSASSADGIYIRRDPATNSGKWMAVGCNATNCTAIDTGLTYADGTLYRFYADNSALSGTAAVAIYNHATGALLWSGNVSNAPAAGNGNPNYVGWYASINQPSGANTRTLDVVRVTLGWAP